MGALDTNIAARASTRLQKSLAIRADAVAIGIQLRQRLVHLQRLSQSAGASITNAVTMDMQFCQRVDHLERLRQGTGAITTDAVKL